MTRLLFWAVQNGPYQQHKPAQSCILEIVKLCIQPVFSGYENGLTRSKEEYVMISSFVCSSRLQVKKIEFAEWIDKFAVADPRQGWVCLWTSYMFTFV